MRILIDGKNATKAAFHVNGKLKTSTGLQTGLATNLLSQLHRLMRVLAEDGTPATEIYFLWENHRCWRHDFYEGYKGNRTYEDREIKPGEPDWRQQLGVLFKVFETLPISVFIGEKLEADDLAYLLKPETGPATYLSNDYDWLQLLSHNCSVYQSRLKRMVTLENLYAETGYEDTEELIKMFSICGDGGDGIPGVVGVGEKTAIKYLRGNLKPGAATHKSITAWMKDPEGYERSRTMFDMSRIPDEVRDSYSVKHNSMDRERLLALATDMEWKTVLGKFDAWTGLFDTVKAS